jgi:hypothetical protein
MVSAAMVLAATNACGGTDRNESAESNGGVAGAGVSNERDYALLPFELVSPSAVRLADGDIFIYGGRVTRGSLAFPRAAQRYSVSAGTFLDIEAASTVTDYPSQTFAFVTPAGAVLVIDDQSGTQVTGRRYDLAADTWAELPPPVAPDGSLDAAVQLQDGDVLVLRNKGAMRLTPDTGQWQVTGETLTDSIAGAAAVLSDGSVLNVSGLGSPPSVYDPETNSWRRAAAPRIARRSASLIALAEGRALLVGGVLDTDELAARATVTETELYDVETDTWVDGPQLEASQTTPTLTLLQGDVLVWGGLSFPCDSAVPCGGRAVSRIDLSAGSVSSLPSMSAPGAPLPFELSPTEYLLILSSSYHRYSLDLGPRAP